MNFIYFTFIKSVAINNDLRGGGGGGGGGLRGPAAKHRGYHQLIEIKFCMSHYSHDSMPDAKFKSGSFSSFEDMT